MPPKLKPRGKRFPPKITPKPVPQQIQTDQTPSSSGLDLEAENKFELELCWCIQQLELGVTSNKLGDKQMRDAQKNLKLLKSNNVPLIQKRQIMRTTFGDYRAKMLQEEKKHSKMASTAKISTPKSSDNKSVFLKKAKGHQDSTPENSENQTNNENSTLTLSQLFKKSKSDEPFKFNFTTSDTN